MKSRLIIFLLANYLAAGSLSVFNWKDPNQFAISPSGQTKKQQFDSLNEELTEINNTEKEFDKDIKQEQAKIKKNITVTQDALKDSVTDRDYLMKKLGLLNDTNQTILDTQLIRKQISSTLEQHVDLLEEYLKDPTFKLFRIPPKASYGYEEITELYRRIANQEELIVRLKEEKKATDNELEARKKSLTELTNNLKQKEKAQKDFTINDENSEQNEIKIKQKAELLDIEKDLLVAQKRLAEYKVKESTEKLAYLQNQLGLAETKLKLFQQDLTVVERSFWVDIKDLNRIQEQYDKNKQQGSKQMASYSEKISSLAAQEEKKRKEFETLAKEHQIELTDMNALRDWSLDGSQFTQEPIIYELGLINDQKQVLDREVKLAEVQKELERIRLNADSVFLQIITTWFSLNHKQLKTPQDIAQEISKYDLEKQELERLLGTYKEKSNLASNLIAIQTRSLQNIKDKIANIQNQKEEFNQKFGAETTKKTLGVLGRAESAINKQIDLSGRIIKTYSQLKTLVQDQLKQINAITNKLNKVGGVLQRAESALSWKSLKNIAPEITNFLKDLQTIFLSYITQFEFGSLFDLLKEKSSWIILLALFIIFLAVGLSYSFFQHLNPQINNIFLKSHYPNKWNLYFMRAMGIGLQFAEKHFFGLTSWLIIFTLIETNWMLNVGFIVLFYIASIPYLIWLILKLAQSFAKYREITSPIFISSPFKRRFLLVLTLIGCSTTTILLLNGAYSAVTTGKSDFSLLLQALLRLIIQLCLLFLIGKEEILSVIPTNHWLGKSAYDFVQKYYYLLIATVITLMVLSDPHLGGWGKLVNFVLSGLFFTTILLIIGWWLQKFIRETSYKIFFVPNAEQLFKERFPYAKAWYGLFLVLSFLALIFTVLYFGAYIWGQALSFDRLKNILNVELFYIKTPDPTNPQKMIFQPFNVVSLIIVFLFIFGGLIAAWMFEKFILQRIFAVLFVDPGVQNTVSRIARYFIIILFFMLGLLKVDLGASIFYLVGAILLGIAWALKGPVNDIISYFTILVERSVKIGDYIELRDHDQQVMGVVRKINLRTVVVRRNNSVSIVVPNSVITNNSVYNWNYVPSYFAFPDMMLTVTYQADPQKVKEIILKVLEENGNILKRPEPIIRLEDFSVNGYTFLIRGFLTTNKVLEQWDIASAIRFALAKELFKSGIRICTPARVITIENNQKEF